MGAGFRESAENGTVQFSERTKNNVMDICKNDTYVTICVDVTNTGAMAGAEVVQCYVADCECSVELPDERIESIQESVFGAGGNQESEDGVARAGICFL